MHTDDVVALALEMAGMDALPGDSAVYLPGEMGGRVLCGLDIGLAELSWAKEAGFTGVLAHHPMGGAARFDFHRVYRQHVGQMVAAGVGEAAARAAVEPFADEHRDLTLTQNVDHVPSFASLVGLPFLNLHQPLDEIGRVRYAEVFAGLPAGAAVGDLLAAVRAAFTEYRHLPESARIGMGADDAPVGRLAWSHAVGTNPGRAGADAYFGAGVDTLAVIHFRGDLTALRDRWAAEGKNLLVMGHLVADSVGINPFVAELESRGVEVTRCSGVLAP